MSGSRSSAETAWLRHDKPIKEKVKMQKMCGARFLIRKIARKVLTASLDWLIIPAAAKRCRSIPLARSAAWGTVH
jgi:hypothetical protein